MKVLESILNSGLGSIARQYKRVGETPDELREIVVEKCGEDESLGSKE